MKLKHTLAASLIAIMAALSLNVSAAADADTKTEKAAPQKKMRPHSHVQDKTGIPQNAPAAMPDKPNAAKDRIKHFHPRDGK